MRAPFNVLILPYCKNEEEFYFCVFKRADSNIWQFIAGGGEDDEDFLSAAKREAQEEANIPCESEYLELESMCYVSADNFSVQARAHWGKKYVIPVYAFAVQTERENVQISHEHTEYRWLTYTQARELLYFDLDKTALYELNEIITHRE